MTPSLNLFALQPSKQAACNTGTFKDGYGVGMTVYGCVFHRVRDNPMVTMLFEI